MNFLKKLKIKWNRKQGLTTSIYIRPRMSGKKTASLERARFEQERGNTVVYWNPIAPNFSVENNSHQPSNPFSYAIQDRNAENILNLHSEQNQASESQQNGFQECMNGLVSMYNVFQALTPILDNAIRIVQPILNVAVTLTGRPVDSLTVMDKRFPHRCFNRPKCDRTIQYKHALGKFTEEDEKFQDDIDFAYMCNYTQYWIAIANHKATKRFNKIWKDSRVWFYCCDCFKREKEKEEHLKREKLKEKLMHCTLTNEYLPDL